ncbi:MAG: hypothetical protein IJT18_05205 [Oscillospiraceae bacterium]|nr:hypothetical protein [Oscillospiraceae bacterium]
MKKLIVWLLTLTLLVTALLPLTASATAALPGDVNADGTVGSMDVTVLRRWLVGGYGINIVTPQGDSATPEDNELTVLLPSGSDVPMAVPADVDGDGVIGVADVTVLRRGIAGGYGVTFAESETYSAVEIDLKNDTTLYKTYGRTYMGDNGLQMLWPGNAIEFTAVLSGSVTLSYTSSDNGYLQSYVDGEANTRARLFASSDEKKLVVAENIQPGLHTVRIVRDNDIVTTAGSYTAWSAVSFTGVKSSVTAPQDKDLLIEYVGDSITSGKGVMSSAQYSGDDPNHSVTHAYSYVSAQTLDADWVITSRGGAGFIRIGSCPKTMADMYDYVNPFDADSDLVEYGFAHKADVVVLALGTNDSVTGTEFIDAAKAMIQQIKDRNGDDTVIVVMYGMMTGSHYTELAQAAAESGVYSLQVTRNNDGGSSSPTGTGHPGIEGQAKVADELVAFLETIL